MDKLYDIAKFSGNKDVSFNLLKLKVKNALYSEGLERYLIEPPSSKANGKDMAQQAKEDRRAASFLMGTLAESLFVRYTHDEPPIATLSLMKSKETTVRLMLRQCTFIARTSKTATRTPTKT